jgi:trypsin
MGRTRLALLSCLALGLLAAAPIAQAQSPQPRIVGGDTTTIEQYPWQVALVFDERFGGNDFQRQFCGGALLTARIVQTAAHCVFDGDPDPADNTSLDPNDLDVVLGRTTLSGSGGDELNVKGDVVGGGVYIEPSYNPVTQQNDFAWIVLAADANVASPAIETIDVAGGDEDPVWSTGRQSQVTGWGDTSFGGSQSDTLRVATVPVVSDATCGHPDVYGLEFFATSMVCAGYLAGGVDSCQGDSGGPMQAPLNGGGFRLVGLVSWGDGCAGANAPGVQSRIADYPTLQDKIDQIETAEGITEAELVIGTGGAPPPVTNDLFSAALNLGSGTNLITATTNVDATKETGEPTHAGNPGGHSLWHTWTAPGDGTTSVNLCGSDFEFDTLLAVYVGGDITALTLVASNDDSAGCGADGAQSSLSFPATAGTTYRIAVDGAFDGVAADTGRMELRLVHQAQGGGSGGGSEGAQPVQATTISPIPTANDPFSKCHKLKSKKKRKRCFRKVRASLGR